MRHRLLRQMVGRLAAARSGWTQSFGPVGRGIRDAELVGMFRAAPDIDNPWAELERVLDTYAAVARDVFAQLGAEYPVSVEEGVRARLAMLAR